MMMKAMMKFLSHNQMLSRHLAASFCALLMAVSAYATDYGYISVRVEAVTESHSSTGYDEYRATIINRSPTKTHRVMVEMIGGSYGETVSAVRRAAESAPSSVATVSLFKPQGSAGYGFWVSIDGERQDEAIDFDASRTSAWISHSHNAFFVLSSRNVEKSGLMNNAAVVEGFKNASGESEVAYLAYKSPMSEWSGNWLGYSGFDAVLITAEELREAPDAVRSALWSYVECGGAMVVIGGLDIPGQWPNIPIQWWERRGIIAGAGNTDSYSVGFGRVTVIEAADIERVTSSRWQAIKLDWKNSRPAKKAYYDIEDINRDFTVIERIGIPVRGLFVLMLAFVVVIGPVNLIWLARRRRKIWMLWTVPAIALITCLAITGYALFAEGVSATSRTEAWTILDESSHRATTIGWTAFYAPITPGEGLRFSYDTELIPEFPQNWLYQGGADARTIDFTTGQHLDSGWITARVPAYFRFRKSETRRERLTISRSENGSIRVVNGLGTDIRQIWLADRDGKIHKAESIQAGAQSSLSPTTVKAAGHDLRELYGAGDWPGKMKYVEQNAAQYLTPGSYLAVLDASPFVEEGLKDLKTRKGRALIYGVSAEAAR